MKLFISLIFNYHFKSAFIYILIFIWFSFQDLLMYIEEYNYSLIEPNIIYILGIARSSTTGIQTTILNSSSNTIGLKIFDLIYPANLFKNKFKIITKTIYYYFIKKYNSSNKSIIFDDYTEDHFLIRKIVYIMIIPEILLYIDINKLFIFDNNDIIYIKRVIQRKYINNNIYISKSIRLSNNIDLLRKNFKNIEIIITKRKLIDCLRSYNYMFYNLYKNENNIILYEKHLEIYIKHNIYLYNNLNYENCIVINFHNWIYNYKNILYSLKNIKYKNIKLFKDNTNKIITDLHNNIFSKIISKNNII